MMNPFTMIARAMFGPFKAAILATWEAAKESAFAEIKQSLPTDADVAEARALLVQLSSGGEQQAAIEEPAVQTAVEDEGETPKRGKAKKG